MSSNNKSQNTSYGEYNKSKSVSDDDSSTEHKKPASKVNNEVSEEDKNKTRMDTLKIMLKHNIPIYEDITPMINSAVPFLIDGDSLMMYAFLQKNHEVTLGGQYLHVIYFCERFLQALQDKGGNLIIVFFHVWENFWGDNSYIQNLRLSLRKHLEKFTTYILYDFTSFASDNFKKFLEVEKPRCLLLDLKRHISIEEFNERVSPLNMFTLNVENGLDIICAEILFFRAHNLPCIDIHEIDIEVSIISSFNLHSDPSLKEEANQLCTKLEEIPSLLPRYTEFIVHRNYCRYDARRALVIMASSKFILAIEDINVLKLILLTYASLEVLHLEHRCCPVLNYTSSALVEVQSILIKWLDCLSSAFKYSLKNEIELIWENIADMWQGTLFGYICYIVRNTISSGSQLGQLQEAYEHYIQLVRDECNIELDCYPIKPLQPKESLILVSPEEHDEEERIDLYRLNNTLVRGFCGDAFQNAKWRKPFSSLKSEEFDETTHWHCKKPITDDWDRMKDEFSPNPKYNHQSNEAWKRKQITNYARYLDVYGQSLEGGIKKTKTIICQSENDVPKNMPRNKKAEIIEKNKNRKIQDCIIEEKKAIQKLKDQLHKYQVHGEIELKLKTINFACEKLKMEDSITSAKLLKLEAYKKHIETVKAVEINVDMIKDIFLIIKSILQSSTAIEKMDQVLLSKVLHELGFGEIARRNKLPTDVTYKEIHRLNWVRFQLEHLGAQMERVEGGEYDPDVGFTPDPWQAKFIDAIRKEKSALVVAPTSSGKTFAAYYCMKRVLKGSKNGIVVYVAPTKALVNQVEATVYARFKNTKLPAGEHVVGVFTRDYKRNTFTSRILVTVPQCLDIILLSPRRYTWLKNLKYVIFDEIHKLSGNVEGLVWERCLLLIRCPFLALSATISDVPKFYEWLVANEMFKREQDSLHDRMRKSYDVVLVEHTERHSDLIKHIYDVGTGLENYHPYCALDSRVIEDHNGIPSTVNLSPREVLQLYDVMSSEYFSKDKFTEKTDMCNYFSNICESGFIRRNDVREYEKVIAALFYEVHQEDENISNDIIENLKPREMRYEPPNVDEIPNLLNCMAERNMLPCLVFSYNRDLIEKANKAITTYCCASEHEEGRRAQKRNEKKEKLEKKLREKIEGSNKDQPTQRTANSSAILRSTGSKFKGEGKADTQDMEFIERRLQSTSYNAVFNQGLPYGVGYHHSGLNNKLRSTIEILFRLGIVKVVFATGTLALGIHMPCKSVVVYGDSPFLNSIEYHQMSGRAGRRGFDTEGNVIFMSLSKNRRNMLMTDKLPKMLGNFPVSVSLIARLLLLVTKVTDRGNASNEVTDITVSKALTLLENSLLFQTIPNMKQQIKHFVDFAAQLLFIQGLYSADGVPLKLASIVNHLHYHEPANLVFAYLFRTGALRKFISSIDNPNDIEWGLIIILSHLFARLKLHKFKQDLTFNNSVVVLEPLPENILQAIEKYNKEVKQIFNEYFMSVATYLSHSLGKDDTLPVSGVKCVPLYSYGTEEKPDSLSAKIKSACLKRVACSSFIALSGSDDSNLYTTTVISNIRHEICPSIKIVPLLDTGIVHNSYAADFYRHGVLSAIRNDNGLKAGSEYARLNDFHLVLKALVVCLDELEPVHKNDMVYMYFKKISNKFHDQFKKAFP